MARTPTLINADAGSAASEPEIGRRVSDALAGAGIMADVALVAAEEVESRCRELAHRGERLVIVGGGDGTLRAAASALAGSSTALGILPLGTLNHFARDLGVPPDLDQAATLIGRGREKRVDVAEMNGRVFINNSAIGLYPLMLVDRDLQRRRLGRSKRLAMIVASLRTLVRFNHQRLRIAINDRAAQLDTPLLFVGNNDYRIDLGAAGQRERLDEGHLCVMVMRKKTRRGLIAASLRALVGRSRPDDMVRIEGVERLVVTSHCSTLLVSLDGEVVPAAPPLRYTMRKRALRVIAPAREPKAAARGSQRGRIEGGHTVFRNPVRQGPRARHPCRGDRDHHSRRRSGGASGGQKDFVGHDWRAAGGGWADRGSRRIAPPRSAPVRHGGGRSHRARRPAVPAQPGDAFLPDGDARHRLAHHPQSDPRRRQWRIAGSVRVWTGLSAGMDFLLAVLLIAGLSISTLVISIFGPTPELVASFAWVLAASFVVNGLLLLEVANAASRSGINGS